MDDGKELLRLRLRLGLTQVSMARRLGLFVNTLSNYERGVRKVPVSVLGYARCIADHNHKRGR